MRITPVTGTLGAVLSDVDLRALSEETVHDLLDAIHEFEVVFLRDVHLSEDEQLSVARKLGRPSIFPMSALMGVTEPSGQVIADGPESPNRSANWHTDVTWTACPPAYAVLCALEMPPHGGDTLWASMTAAHDALSPVMAEFLAGLSAVHDNESFIRGVVDKAPDHAEQFNLPERLRSEYPPVSHPLVRTHPHTGRRILFHGGNFTRHIEGMTSAESDAVLSFIEEQRNNPALHVRWKWTPGDVAIWDERSTNHRAANDHGDQVRVIRRIEVDGERPFFDPHRTPRAKRTAVGADT